MPGLRRRQWLIHAAWILLTSSTQSMEAFLLGSEMVERCLPPTSIDSHIYGNAHRRRRRWNERCAVDVECSFLQGGGVSSRPLVMSRPSRIFHGGTLSCSSRHLPDPDEASLSNRPVADVRSGGRATPDATPQPSPRQGARIIAPFVHHVAIQTSNITRTTDFYSLFGYQVACRFRAGPARAAWLELDGSGHWREGGDADDEVNSPSSSPSGCRLELIEVPAYLFDTGPPPASSAADSAGATKRPHPRAVDAFSRPTYLGYHHVALDVTSQIRSMNPSASSIASDEAQGSAATGNRLLGAWIEKVNATSVERFGKSLRLALAPRQQIIGTAVYELAFLYDDSGCLLELLNRVSDRKYPVSSGWEPWDGKDFSGSAA